MKLPEKVKVGWREYRVQWWDANEARTAEKWAECDKDNAIIRISTDRPEDDTIETFLHEILHACYHEWRIEDTDYEERTVSSLSTALMSVFKENPEVVKLLK